LTTVPLDPSTGRAGSVIQTTKTPTRTKKKAPTQHGEDPHGKHRSDETHAHCLELDPVTQAVAYVPDLGEDSLKQFAFDQETGVLTPSGDIFTGDLSTGPHGPRYLVFHPEFNVCYVINELASTIAVFELDEGAVNKSLENPGSNTNTLKLVQTISTIPKTFPKTANTCGGIKVSPCGNYVLGANRGHDSIAVLKVNRDTSNCESGWLSTVGIFHTCGKTPRHFNFDATGKWVLACNQDSDMLAVFSFCLETGEMEFKYQYNCPSPNFIGCAQPTPERYEQQQQQQQHKHKRKVKAPAKQHLPMNGIGYVNGFS